MLRVIAFLFLSVVAQAQTWTQPYYFETGFFNPNPDGCEPVVNEPTEWSRVHVPLPPDGADLVFTTITEVEYGVAITATNVSSVPASYLTTGLYNYRIGHIPGLYHANQHLYATGHGFDQDAAVQAHVVATGAGGGGFFRTVDPGQTDESVTTSVFQATSTDIRPITPEWMTPDRRGAKSLFVTSQGAYSWNWSWGYGVPPPNWGSHSPLSYSMTQRVRLRGWVKYGSF